MSEQQAQLERVEGSIGDTVVEFCQPPRATFHAEELRDYVRTKCGASAPASADRILRSLRSAGKVNYKIVDRSKSLYEIIPAENAQN